MFWANVVLSKCYFEPMLFWVNLTLNICCFEHMLFWAYVVLSICCCEQLLLRANVVVRKDCCEVLTMSNNIWNHYIWRIFLFNFINKTLFIFGGCFFCGFNHLKRNIGFIKMFFSEFKVNQLTWYLNSVKKNWKFLPFHGI